MRDAVAIFKKGVYLAERDHLPLFVFGRSLGGAAAIHVLSRP
jgi:abhydrolase domain-containing protein 13